MSVPLSASRERNNGCPICFPLEVEPWIGFSELQGYCSAEAMPHDPFDLWRSVEDSVGLNVTLRPARQTKWYLDVVPDVSNAFGPGDVEINATGEHAKVERVGPAQTLAIFHRFLCVGALVASRTVWK